MALVCVFGASGRQGMAQVRQLSLAGHRVRALSRSPDPFYGVHYANVEIVPADINDDRSMAHAFDGADAVFYTHPFRGPAPGAMRARTIARSRSTVWDGSRRRRASSASSGTPACGFRTAPEIRAPMP